MKPYTLLTASPTFHKLFITKPVKIYIYISIYIYMYVWFFSMLNWSKLNTLPNLHFRMTNNWTITFHVLTAAVVPTMAFFWTIYPLCSNTVEGIYCVLCLPSGWLHLVQVDVKYLGGRNVCYIYIYIYIYTEKEREREVWGNYNQSELYRGGKEDSASTKPMAVDSSSNTPF